MRTGDCDFSGLDGARVRYSKLPNGVDLLISWAGGVSVGVDLLRSRTGGTSGDCSGDIRKAASEFKPSLLPYPRTPQSFPTQVGGGIKVSVGGSYV